MAVSQNLTGESSYWGVGGPTQAEFLAKIHEIGPLLDSESQKSEEEGQLTQKAIDALASTRLSHIFVPENLGGYQLSPTRGLELIEQITYYSGGAGWVAMVYASIGAMSAGYLPDAACDVLFAPDTNNRFAGQGAPTGMLKRVEGGYILNGKWSYGSGFSHATWSHSAAFIDDGTGKPEVDETGAPIILCVHAPIPDHEFSGNWDVLGLKATGSIDYIAKDVFIGEDYVFPIMTAIPQRMEAFFSLGVVGLAAIGHSGWAIGASRRMMDELAEYARSKRGRPGLVGESEYFWTEYAKHEARIRAARAFLFEVWRDVEATVQANQPVSTRQLSFVHLAKAQVHEAGADACTFAYRTAGGASLRNGIMQRLFREMFTATQHITVSTGMLRNCGREILGMAEGYEWRYNDLVPAQ